MNQRYRIYIDEVPTYAAGDPAPQGYTQWHEWAKVQARAGLRQRRCVVCHRFMFPQELDADRLAAGDVICVACAAHHDRSGS